MRKKQGYIKLFSKLLDHKLTPCQFTFFVKSILIADPSDYHKGEVNLSIRQLTEIMGMSKNCLHQQRQWLINNGYLVEMKHGYKVINYLKFQASCPTIRDKQSEDFSLSHQKGQVVPPKGTDCPTKRDTVSHEMGQNEPAINKNKVLIKNKEKEINKEKIVYGEFRNVRLTIDEYGKLLERFGGSVERRIGALSEWKESKGRNTKSDYATILSWDRLEQKRSNDNDGKGNFQTPRKYKPASEQ